MGEIPVRTLNSVDADIAALDNVIQAILFYDDIVVIDDYKEEYRESRKERFGEFRFLDPSLYNLPEVNAAAQEQAELVRPTISGGEFRDDDMRELLENLKMHMVCTWDMSSSVFYLTMKLLGKPDTEEFEKYSRLSASIFQELQDQYRAGGNSEGTASLFDSKGRPIGDDYTLTRRNGKAGEVGGMSPALETFIAALRWLSYRTIYYSIAAQHLQADLFLYPVRQAYHIHYMSKTGDYGADFTSSVLASMSGKVSSTVEAVINVARPSRIDMRIPVFSAWLVSQTNNVKSVLRMAFEIRDDSAIADARGQLREIRNLYDSDALEEASEKTQKILRHLDRSLAEVRRRFGIKTEEGPSLATLVKVLNPILSLQGLPGLPKLGEDVALPDWMTNIIPKRGAAALYRDIGSDLSNYPKLGKIRDQLGAAVWLDDSQPTHSPKAEDPKYRYAKSRWKIPM